MAAEGAAWQQRESRGSRESNVVVETKGKSMRHSQEVPVAHAAGGLGAGE